MKFITIFCKVIFSIGKIYNRIWMYLQFPLFKSVGKNVILAKRGIFSHGNIVIGNDVYIGPNAYLTASHSEIIIGNKVLIGPNVVMLGGDHNHKKIGEYIYDSKEKIEGLDKDIVIEDDVWIGANVTILKGVTIKRGSIIAAGSIVTKSVPEYSMYKLKIQGEITSRFSTDELTIHKEKISMKNREV